MTPASEDMARWQSDLSSRVSGGRPEARSVGPEEASAAEAVTADPVVPEEFKLWFTAFAGAELLVDEGVLRLLSASELVARPELRDVCIMRSGDPAGFVFAVCSDGTHFASDWSGVIWSAPNRASVLAGEFVAAFPDLMSFLGDLSTRNTSVVPGRA